MARIDQFRKRNLPEEYKKAPEIYLQKLELKQYSMNTAKSYVNLFENFMRFYKDKDINSLDENDIRIYLLHLIHLDKSTSYLNQAINSIKFYYEVVMGMPNRFYSIERPMTASGLPEITE